MLRNPGLAHHFSFLFLVFILLTDQGCSSDKKITISCGDLFSEYSEKPDQLTFVKCSKGQGQILLDAEYRVSSQYAEAVEQFLVKKYGLMKFSDFYHSMPTNEVYLSPESLTKIQPYYVLRILISHKNLELHNDNNDSKTQEFLVNVMIMEI